MFKANDGDAIPVIRRVGGLEDIDGVYPAISGVIRRVGGLEASLPKELTLLYVIRRVGGLEGLATTL